MAAPYFKDVVVGNVGRNLQALGYSNDAIVRYANQLADEWMRIMTSNPSGDPRRLAVYSDLDVAADGSPIEPLHLTFRLMPRSNGEVAGWLLNQAEMDEPVTEPTEQKSAIHWTASFSVVNAVWEDGTSGLGYVVHTGDPHDPVNQAAFDDPWRALHHLYSQVAERLGLEIPREWREANAITDEIMKQRRGQV